MSDPPDTSTPAPAAPFLVPEGDEDNPWIERTVTLDEWRAEGLRRFGPHTDDWRYVCPSCGGEASGRAYAKRGGGGKMGVVCLGQFIPEEELPEDTYCQYGVGGGAQLIHPVRVVLPDQTVMPFFDFADGPWPSTP